MLSAKSLIWSLAIDGVIMVPAAFGGTIEWFSAVVVLGTLAIGACTGILGGLVGRAGALEWFWAKWGITFSWRDHWSTSLSLSDEERVSVHMADGRTYLGWPLWYSDDPAREKELVLTETWVVDPRIDAERPVYLGQQVYMPAAAIASIDKVQLAEQRERIPEEPSQT